MALYREAARMDQTSAGSGIHSSVATAVGPLMHMARKIKIGSLERSSDARLRIVVFERATLNAVCGTYPTHGYTRRWVSTESTHLTAICQRLEKQQEAIDFAQTSDNTEQEGYSNLFCEYSM